MGIANSGDCDNLLFFNFMYVDIKYVVVLNDCDWLSQVHRWHQWNHLEGWELTRDELHSWVLHSYTPSHWGVLPDSVDSTVMYTALS
jgi:hypothetical protein